MFIFIWAFALYGSIKDMVITVARPKARITLNSIYLISWQFGFPLYNAKSTYILANATKEFPMQIYPNILLLLNYVIINEDRISYLYICTKKSLPAMGRDSFRIKTYCISGHFNFLKRKGS